MPWRWCLLVLALSGVASAQVQPARNLQILSDTISERSVTYTFDAPQAGLTPGATYRVTFTPLIANIPTPQAEIPDNAGLRTTSGLTPDVTYRLEVFVVLNGVDSTPISDEFTTLPDVPTGPPLGLTVSARTTTSITLTWSDPAPDRINDRDGVTGFEVRRNEQRVVTVTDRTYTFTGLSAATSYDFEVLAINEQGIAPDNHAAELAATTASGIPNPPILRVVLPRFSLTYLVWRDPEPVVGDITGVEIRYLIDGVPVNIPEQSGGVNQYSVSGIAGSVGKTHSVSLRAKTSAGYSPYSDPVVFTFQPIAVVEVEPVDCDTLQVSYTVNPLPNPLPGGDNEATLQSLELTYRVIVGTGSTETRSVALNTNGVAGMLCLTGLEPDMGYRVTYVVEVETGLSTLPSDIASPVEVSTLRSCVQQAGQCAETSATITTPPPTSASGTVTTPPTSASGTGAAVSVMSASAVLTITFSLVGALVLQTNMLQ